MGRRPCRICRRWFSPHPRLGARQRTCGDPECRRQWHRKKCAEWNRKNAACFKANYLDRKIEDLSKKGSAGVGSRFSSGLPVERVQEVIGVQQFVMIEYLVRLLLKRFQELIRVQLAARTG